jgi:hypothetical protein
VKEGEEREEGNGGEREAPSNIAIPRLQHCNEVTSCFLTLASAGHISTVNRHMPHVLWCPTERQARNWADAMEVQMDYYGMLQNHMCICLVPSTWYILTGTGAKMISISHTLARPWPSTSQASVIVQSMFFLGGAKKIKWNKMEKRKKAIATL